MEYFQGLPVTLWEVRGYSIWISGNLLMKLYRDNVKKSKIWTRKIPLFENVTCKDVRTGIMKNWRCCFMVQIIWKQN